jgi:hypothetical protein
MAMFAMILSKECTALGLWLQIRQVKVQFAAN